MSETIVKTESRVQPAVRVREVTVRMGWRKVLQNVDLAIESGNVMGLVGPNGAGKTTLIRTIVGAIGPDAGTVETDGGSVGWVSHASFLYDELTVEENLSFWAKLASVKDADRRIIELADFFELRYLLQEPVGTLSHGMVKRVSIARALLGSPKLLTLDEPFSGLDQVGTGRLIEVIASYRRSQRAVLISSHQVSTVLKHSSHLGVMIEGRMVVFGSIDEFDADRLKTDYVRYALELERQGQR